MRTLGGEVSDLEQRTGGSLNNCRHRDMNDQPPTQAAEPSAVGSRTMVLALGLAGLSLITPAILWGIGRWAVIFSGAGVLCAASLAVLLLSIRAIRRGCRGPSSYVAVVVSGLALIFWCFLMFVFISLSRGGAE